MEVRTARRRRAPVDRRIGWLAIIGRADAGKVHGNVSAGRAPTARASIPLRKERFGAAADGRLVFAEHHAPHGGDHLPLASDGSSRATRWVVVSMVAA